MSDPVRGNLRLHSVIPGQRMRSGMIITARINDILPDGRVRLHWNGRILTARSHLNLKPGQLIRASVERTRRGVSLHVTHRESAFVHRPRAPSFMPQTMLTAALIRAGLSSPDEGEVARKSALLSRTKGRTLRVSRTYAELLAKGADPTAGFLETLDLLFSDQDTDSRQGSRKKHREALDMLNPGPLSQEMMDDAGEAVLLWQLLNPIPGKTGQWVFARNSLKLGGDTVRMVWKIRRGMNPALALTVYDGDRTLEFLLEGLDNTRLSVHSDSLEKVNKSIWRKFRESLALMNIDVDATIRPIDESDGFTPGVGRLIHDLEKRG